MKKGDKVKVYQRPITQEDYEGVFELVSYWCDSGTWAGMKFEVWLVEDDDGKCLRTVSERDIIK